MIRPKSAFHETQPTLKFLIQPDHLEIWDCSDQKALKAEPFKKRGKGKSDRQARTQATNWKPLFHHFGSFYNTYAAAQRCFTAASIELQTADFTALYSSLQTVGC